MFPTDAMNCQYEFLLPLRSISVQLPWKTSDPFHWQRKMFPTAGDAGCTEQVA